MNTAIYAALDQQKKDTLIKEALAFLLEPNRTGYGTRDSPLMDCFREEARKYAHEACIKYIAEHEEFRTAIDTAIVEGYKRFLTTFGEKLYDKIGEHIADALSKRDY